MKKSKIILCGLALVGCLWAASARAQYQPPTFVYPAPNGSYMIDPPKGPPTFVYPAPNGSYMITPPSGSPTFIYPLPNGGGLRPYGSQGQGPYELPSGVYPGEEEGGDD